MPLYEYKCEGCGQLFEVIEKFSDEPLTVHEACGGPVHRLLSAPSFQFKGSGWYINDYGSGKGKTSEGNGSKTGETKPAESKPASDTGKSSTDSNNTSTDSKPSTSSSSSSSSGTETKSS